jgi:hypothetical protein
VVRRTAKVALASWIPTRSVLAHMVPIAVTMTRRAVEPSSADAVQPRYSSRAFLIEPR